MNSTLHNRFGRLLRLLSLLQAGPRYNALQLAQELGVSRRTIFRDIALLRELGVPIDFHENADGYGVSGGSIRAVTKALDRDQLETLLLAGHLSALQAAPGFAASIRDATANLLGKFSPTLRGELSNLFNSCVIEMDSSVPPPDSRILSTVLTGIRTQHQIRLTLRPNGAQERLRTKVAPYQLRFSPDQWRLVGRSSYHRSVCTFDVESIEAAELTEDTFDVPRGFYSRQTDSQGAIDCGYSGKP